jgi:hypothetical protein
MNIDIKERILVTSQPDDDIEWWYQEWITVCQLHSFPQPLYRPVFPGMEDTTGMLCSKDDSVITAAQLPRTLQMPYERSHAA